MPSKKRPTSPIPPLNWLRAFEAAARHASFKMAAQELNVTPAAISQQIKLLEDYFDIKLFERRARSLALTRIGSLSAPLLSKALIDISRACEVIGHDTRRDWLVVTAPLSFCMKWLVPRLERFQERHPDIEVRIDATDELLDLRHGQADIGIRYGKGNYPGLHVTPLIGGAYHAVVSPRLLQKRGGLEDISQLSNFALVHTDWRGSRDAVPSWGMWLQAAGIRHPHAEKGHLFSNEMMAIEAAISELGIALVSRANVEEDLAAGRLVSVLDNHRMKQADFRYFLVRGQVSNDPVNVDILHAWICAEAGVAKG